ncbi:putative nuclease HARBI1 [Xyrauchen texanus]|uniref:putative nuclease HARBI1 n=1 Tax=Xyrauchen texanus TaxID=154827 RepID=UPI002242AE2D|nr:putative nuclease HARBI1 [Xyrauchen texanus]
MTLLHGPILQFARWLKKVALVIAGCWETVDILFSPYLLTPVQHPATIAEERFNQAHGRTRSIVERTIGLWKQSFRCISKSSGGLKLNPTKSCSVIVVTAILHNIAVRENVQLPEEEVGAVGADGEEDAVSDDDPLNPHQGRMHPAGAEVRELLIQNMFG